jgi:hypothetical protein
VASVAFAHDPVTTKLTWSAEISRIVYNRCVNCHRDGGNTPMALLDYEQARPWAKAIRDEVLARRMPPWGAVKGYGEFQGDRSLTQDEMNRIAEWVEGGAPEGDPKVLPAKPKSAEAPIAPKGTKLRNPVKLARTTTVLAIAPVGDIPSAKLTAHRPDGSVEPLLWLLEYKGTWRRAYVYKQPVSLPAGTVIESAPRINFDLIVK